MLNKTATPPLIQVFAHDTRSSRSFVADPSLRLSHADLQVYYYTCCKTKLPGDLPAFQDRLPTSGNCDESKCRSPGLLNLGGINYGYDCWANEYGPLPPTNRPYENYTCASGYTGKFVSIGAGDAVGYQYYTCCKSGVNPSAAGDELIESSVLSC